MDAMDWVEYSAPIPEETYGPLDAGSAWSEESAMDKLGPRGPTILTNNNDRRDRVVRPVLDSQLLVRLAS